VRELSIRGRQRYRSGRVIDRLPGPSTSPALARSQHGLGQWPNLAVLSGGSRMQILGEPDALNADSVRPDDPAAYETPTPLARNSVSQTRPRQSRAHGSCYARDEPRGRADAANVDHAAGQFGIPFEVIAGTHLAAAVVDGKREMTTAQCRRDRPRPPSSSSPTLR